MGVAHNSNGDRTEHDNCLRISRSDALEENLVAGHFAAADAEEENLKNSGSSSGRNFFSIRANAAAAGL